MDFAARKHGECDGEEIKGFIADRVDGNHSSICSRNNIVLTYADPQAEPGVMWIAEPQVTDNEEWIKYNI